MLGLRVIVEVGKALHTDTSLRIIGHAVRIGELD